MKSAAYKRGDLVVFQMSKTSTEPGRRAHDVHPAPFGETYTYIVDKFWVVAEVLADQRLLLVTRRGKEHVVGLDDPRLRPSHWWERWIHRERFPDLARIRELRSIGRVPEKIRA